MFTQYVSTICTRRKYTDFWAALKTTCSGVLCSYRLKQHKFLLGMILLLSVGISLKAHTHTKLTALCPGLPGWGGTKKVKPIWILLKQETVSGSGISWEICKSAPRSRQITTPAPHRSVFYRPDALPAAQPTASKH